MQLTKEYLSSKYDYNPRNESFYYKENKHKRVDWNRRYAGTKVKPLMVAGVQYLTVNNAIYQKNQVIKLWEEGNSDKEVKSISIEDLLKKEAKRKAAISSLSHDDLKLLQKNILNDLPYRIGNRKTVKASSKGNKEKVVTRALDVLNVNDTTNRHIYYDNMTNTYYVKVIYKNLKLTHFDFVHINDALEARNKIYNEIIEQEA